MNNIQWESFKNFRDSFREQAGEWQKQFPSLRELQKQAAELAGTPSYPFETPVVYNTSLDLITEEDDIKLIVIGDNPGKDEQLAKNQRYLVGQAGKIAEGYFRRNPELNIDFRKNAIILNKTPVHSAKTAQLKTIAKNGGKEIQDFLTETQNWMAAATAKLHIELVNGCSNKDFIPELWLVGYSELKEGGIFMAYKNTLKQTYLNNEKGKAAWDKTFVFQHFSMNRFSIDLDDYVKKNNLSGNQLISNIHTLGSVHKAEFF